MKRRQGFTLVELMVAMALIIFIMVILSESFAAALSSFRTLKAIGDMDEKLRAAAAILRHDLEADHFEGRRRTSDPFFADQGIPREGFFTFSHGDNPFAAGSGLGEGADLDGNQSYRNTKGGLHFAIKLRGNERDRFASAELPDGSPFVQGGPRTNFFNHPPDALFRDNDRIFRSAWAEVAYFLVENGAEANGTKLHTLYRSQFVVVPDNSDVNSWSGPRPSSGVVSSGELPFYYEFSCQPGPGGTLYFNNPTDITNPNNRALGSRGDPRTAGPKALAATQLLADVISFDVRPKFAARLDGQPAHDFSTNPNEVYDSSSPPEPNFSVPSGNTVNKFGTGSVGSLQAIRVIIRIWDVKTGLSRQITIIQDM